MTNLTVLLLQLFSAAFKKWVVHEAAIFVELCPIPVGQQLQKGKYFCQISIHKYFIRNFDLTYNEVFAICTGNWLHDIWI